MNYRLTPINILAALLIGTGLLFVIVPESMQGKPNSYLSFYLFPLAIAALAVDYFIQKKIKRYGWLWLTELLLILLYFVVNNAT